MTPQEPKKRRKVFTIDEVNEIARVAKKDAVKDALERVKMPAPILNGLAGETFNNTYMLGYNFCKNEVNQKIDEILKEQI